MTSQLVAFMSSQYAYNSGYNNCHEYQYSHQSKLCLNRKRYWLHHKYHGTKNLKNSTRPECPFIKNDRSSGIVVAFVNSITSSVMNEGHNSISTNHHLPSNYGLLPCLSICVTMVYCPCLSICVTMVYCPVCLYV